jgi:hypothetical protein
MKMMKLALLGGAALAVTAAGARADDLSAMKAEIEALNARVAQLETAPAVPAGFQLMTIGSGEATLVPGNAGSDKFGAQVDKVTKISVMPTADAPAAASIEWSGYVRAIVKYDDFKDHQNTTTAGGHTAFYKGHNTEVTARSQIKVVAKTDTSVGEVGARIVTRANLDGVGSGDGTANAFVHEAWGWWAMTPELTLGGGYSGSLGNVGYGYDGACTCYGTDIADVAFNPGDTTQMRLTYASGPFSVAAAIEDGTNHENTFAKPAWLKSNNEFGVAGQVKYSGDMFNGAIDGYWRNKNTNAATFGGPVASPWGIGAGVGFSLGSMASISVGTQYARNLNTSKDWGVSGLASMNLSDAVHAELGAGYKHYNKGIGNAWGLLAGLYYSPVKQLTVGLEGEYAKGAKGNNCIGAVCKASKDTLVDLVTVFAF